MGELPDELDAAPSHGTRRPVTTSRARYWLRVWGSYRAAQSAHSTYRSETPRGREAAPASLKAAEANAPTEIAGGREGLQ